MKKKHYIKPLLTVCLTVTYDMMIPAGTSQSTEEVLTNSFDMTFEDDGLSNSLDMTFDESGGNHSRKSLWE